MIKGFRGTSLVDYPSLLSAVVFFGGCNFRCPFCYNVDLVLPERLSKLPDLPEEEILLELKRREGFIKGVVITGGEPTLNPRPLRHLLEMIRAETTLKIKLDTNGSRPKILTELLEADLLDYVAMDFKTRPERYSELRGTWQEVEESLTLLQKAAISYELRITAVPYFVSQKDLEAMLPWLSLAPRVALQRFMNELPPLNPDIPLGAYGPEELRAFQRFLEERTGGEVVLRNV